MLGSPSGIGGLGRQPAVYMGPLVLYDATGAIALTLTGASSAPANGLYMPSANQVALATNSAIRLSIASDGSVQIGAPTGGNKGAGTINAQSLFINGAGVSATGADTTYCFRANNLSDVVAATARANLGVTATGADTTYCFRANNLSDVTASTARANLGVTATGADTTYCFRGNNLSDVVAASARVNLGVTATGADSTYAFRANNLSDLGSAASARANLGLATIASSASASDLASGTVANARLPNVFAGPGVTIQADPGGTPTGTFGQVFFYY